MADISQYIDNEMTLSAMSNAILDIQQKSERYYLGMSEIGEQCWRMLWYRFRQCDDRIMTIASVLAIEDGFKQEDIMAERLRLVKGIKLDTVDADTGKQFAFTALGGHFRGHADGKISGIYESPKTMHIWENKAVNEKKFKELKNIILDIGEKQALEKWDAVYYAQAQIYMDMAGLTRHFLTVAAPGGRNYTSCRTELSKKYAKSIHAKAETIIKSDRPLPRLSENRSFYLCSWCAMKEICFDTKVPRVGCRTCAFSEPIMSGDIGAWHCHKKNMDFTGAGTACDQHLFLNTLVPFRTVDADSSSATPSWIKYQIDETKETFYNVNKSAKVIKSAQNLTSCEMREKEYFELCFSDEKIKNETLKAKVEDRKITKKLKSVL